MLYPEDITRIYPLGTERTFANQRIRINLECSFEGCKEFVSGIEGYNGSVVCDDGDIVDLRFKEYICDKHKDKYCD
ncbi:hypothetical protein KA005_17890 [bacterium]|nr:hypothetical protein [bacterium]